MPLTLRPTGLSSPAYADKLDYVVCEDGKVIGRIYEDWHTLPDLRWFWSITVYVDPRQGINTSGRAASLRLKRNSFRTGRGAAPTRLHPHSALPSCRHIRQIQTRGWYLRGGRLQVGRGTKHLYMP